MSTQAKAVSLISGGLDSMLATRAIMEQGVHVEGINFFTGFCVEGHTHAIRNKDRQRPKRNNALWVAEQLGIKLHIVDVIEEYKGTDAANLATYAAGMSYLNLQQYQEAISYLEDYKPKDAVTGSLAIGGIGDAFMQLGQPEDALGYYENAYKHDDNEFTAPRFLLKAGITSLEIGQKDKALEYFQLIKDTYSNSAEAASIDAYIGMAQKSD